MKLTHPPKFCSVLYGTCSQEMYTIQGNATEGSPFMITVKLNSSIVRSRNYYIVTASNGTYEIRVNGSTNLSGMSEGFNSDVIQIVLPIVVVGGSAIMITLTLIVITPRACARGKAIGFACRRLSSSVGTKIARSRYVGI